MFRQCLLLLSLSVFFCAKASAQLRENEGAQKRQPESIKEFRVRHRKQGHAVMFWNVENLFDCKDDTLKDDADFQPKVPIAGLPRAIGRNLTTFPGYLLR